MSQIVDIGAEERRQKPTQGRHTGVVRVHLSTTGEYFTYHRQLTNCILFIIDLIITVGFSFRTRTYYHFSEFLNYNFLLSLIIMASMDTKEGSFQTPASKKRKASRSPSLPPASQPTTPPLSYKNRTPLIATGIDPKFNTPVQIMSELRQYHPSLRVFQIRQSSKGWMFIGDTPKDFAILQSETKMKQVFGPKVKVSLPKSYHLQMLQKVNF